MRRNPQQKDKTIGFERIIDDTRKDAIKINLGQKVDVWFPRAAIEIDTENYSLTGEESFINQKLAHADGQPENRKPPKLIELAPSNWENDECIGIDVQVFKEDCGGHSTEIRVFINKALIENGYTPLYIVKSKEAQAISKVNTDGNYADEEFYVQGLRAQEDHKTRSGGGYAPRKSSRPIRFKR